MAILDLLRDIPDINSALMLKDALRHWESAETALIESLKLQLREKLHIIQNLEVENEQLRTGKTFKNLEECQKSFAM